MYSSEWMVLDFQNLQKGKPIPADSFIVFTSTFKKHISEDLTREIQVILS